MRALFPKCADILKLEISISTSCNTVDGEGLGVDSDDIKSSAGIIGEVISGQIGIAVNVDMFSIYEMNVTPSTCIGAIAGHIEIGGAGREQSESGTGVGCTTFENEIGSG